MGQKPLLVDRHERAEGLDPRRIAGPRGRWPPTYGEDVIEPLRKVWAVMDAPAGKPMAPFLGDRVGRLVGFIGVLWCAGVTKCR